MTEIWYSYCFFCFEKSWRTFQPCSSSVSSHYQPHRGSQSQATGQYQFLLSPFNPFIATISVEMWLFLTQFPLLFSSCYQDFTSLVIAPWSSDTSYWPPAGPEVWAGRLPAGSQYRVTWQWPALAWERDTPYQNDSTAQTCYTQVTSPDNSDKGAQEEKGVVEMQGTVKDGREEVEVVSSETQVFDSGFSYKINCGDVSWLL